MLESHFGLKRPRWLDSDYAIMPCPEGGCGDLDGCVETPDTSDLVEELNALTPSCLAKRDIS